MLKYLHANSSEQSHEHLEQRNLPQLPDHGSALATAAIADFPTVYNSEAEPNAKPPTPQESLAKLALPPGFKATVFAAEPDVQNPIAMAWDPRGRLWIAENYTYAEPTIRFDLHLRDRILIFEDNDHDGRFDKRRVFTDDVQQLTSVEVGHGGVWALARPNCCSFPITTTMACPTARRRSCSMASKSRPQTITILPTVSIGDQTVGCTAAPAPQLPAKSENQAQPTPNACHFAAASGDITRAARSPRF